VRFLPGLALVLLVGCDDRYPKDLHYPPRTDLLVVKAPTEQPIYPDSPGQLDHLIGLTNSKGGEALDPRQAPADERRQLNQELSKIFGTPASPKVASEEEEASEAITALELSPERLARGSELYRRHCLHCHGLVGDGRGPSGPWLNPHPRDYRQGKFKFMSSVGGESRKPRRADIRRVLVSGIEGTSMPAFNVLVDDHLDALVSYVIHLSLRGEVEYTTLQTVLKKEELRGDGTIAGDVGYWTTSLLNRWKNASAEAGQIKPGVVPTYNDQEMKQSIVNGYRLFTDPKGSASCIACHLDFGRQVPFRYDVWGTLVRPANLTTGVYRGGRRPIDLFWRIKGGIVPSGMPEAAALSDKEIWDVVNFVQAMPHPRMLPPDVRGRIYVREEQVASR
jgi:mono/diheme cytochrome c family protein